ncbi:myelin-associated glycoprotein isoform X1 [Ctenopharyngodon idella]|uniref:myelin-associated glycoprotein isoform X1 n=1 Tax=Ctenopharyngodon idella TaxID=7959 RepID=UPI0022324615|nr:myelin-associated glycoprotein isoform X1 [Ctenopharyngodon idella]XP_051718600.1 myelin-associated glycoprotein isoform X1 [Ctenopharyngodon idella]XP_051718601.1 myelin-associated glycoprotein isoform X1 [Ctenopharyngodon idella]XP_051718602.1 myelin-associated glycoprotein isoform X1 [Ctenopharyngodon idella]XP_051718603.1 myelin-associated glycoprotein isoform X1 [Ctenopharyngodon idella]XP_051718604.1 myelin-associated glycoprotein isoform X1 [Ctenopharyngodon idella]XP_051718605.1 my
MKGLELLLLPLLLFLKDVRAQWNVWMPRDISAMTNSCVVIPCSFTYPSGIRPYRGVHGIWYFGHPYPQLFPPVVYKSRTDIVHESYKGRTRLLGDLTQKNCTLLISNVGVEHSGRYYFRADLGGANIYTFPDFTKLQVLDQPNIDVPEEIVSDQSLDLTCYVPDNCPDMSPEIHWMYTDYLPDPVFTPDTVEDSNTAVLSSTLTFTPKPMHNGQMLGCRVHYQNTTFVYERLISLDIKYAPRTVWVNVSQEVMEGSSVVLHCDVDSNPVPTITWYFGDKELMSETASNSSLPLENLTPDEEGVYTCVGDNGYGSMNTSMYLAVNYPPREPWINESLTVIEGTSVALQCISKGNPMPTLTWLKDGELVGTITAEEGSVLELHEITPQADGVYRCLAENEHGRASSSLNITVEFAPILLDDSKCTIVREGVQCVCIASGNPEPAIEFYLPDLNITINSSNNRFNYYTHSDGYTSTGIIKLQDKGERGNNGDTAVHVHCSISNMYGSDTIRLELQQEKKYMMAVIVGTIGGVAVIAFIIAAVRYVGQNNKKENGNPGQDVGSKVENPSMFYSAVKKDKQSLRKKVLKTELLGSKFNSILEEGTGDDGDYQSVGPMAGMERQELNYAALEFLHGRHREGGFRRADGDGSDYTEIKAK